MLGKSLLKAAVVIAIALAMIMPASAAITKTRTPTTTPTPHPATRGILLQDGFESYDDFAIAFPPWTNIDTDALPTYGMTGYTWTNQFSPQAYMVFNPAMTSPAITLPDLQPHAGAKFATCWADVPSGSQYNDDWLITQQLSAGTFGYVSFYARSYVSTYGLERFAVGISTTNTQPSSFTIISPGSYVEAPTAWTLYNYSLSSYHGNIYVGFHCVSQDAFIFMLDDVTVAGEGGADLIPPVTTCNLTGTIEGDHYIGDVKVTLSATDEGGSGVAFTMVKVDSGLWGNYTGPFNVTADGDHTVYYYSVDGAGNHETPKSTDFKIQHPIVIAIKGGLGVTATITNNGAAAITANWTIDLSGGLIILGKHKANSHSIAAGGSYNAKDFVLGFGSTTITATANGVTKTATGKVILIFVTGVA